MTNIERKFKENTRDYVYRVIKENIMYLELKPGKNISEVEFSEHLGVSRTPVREALVKLTDEQLVDVFPQRGTFVSKINLAFVEEAFYLRKIVEKDILKLLMENFDGQKKKNLEKNIYLQKGNTELGGETSERFDLDNDFHKIIYSSVSRSRTWDAIKYISTHYDRLRFLDAMEGKTKNRTLEQHIEIFEMLDQKKYDRLDTIVEEHLANYKDEMDYFKKKYPDYFF